MIQWYQLSPSPRYIPMSPCSLFQGPRSSSIKLAVPQAWIMQIAQPNYLMAPNFPTSSLITFSNFLPHHLSKLHIYFHLMKPHWYLSRDPDSPILLWSLLLPENTASCLSIVLAMWKVHQNLSRLQHQMEVWGSQRYILTQTSPQPCSVALRLSQGGLSMEMYHSRHWNILQVSHKVFGACLGFPVSPEILNYKAISWVRCRMRQIILLTESRNDPHNI